MTVITKLLKAARDGTLVVTRQDVRALQRYVRNSRNRNLRKIISADIGSLFASRGVWPLEPDFSRASIAWLQDMVFRKDGTTRTTPNALALGRCDLAVLQRAQTIELTGVLYTLLDYDRRCYPGRERSKDAYCIFRVNGLDHLGEAARFDFVYYPWQARLSGDVSGLLLL